jgi:4-diphosphocytidyl-2-C-methyl-D-erythritol kinase
VFQALSVYDKVTVSTATEMSLEVTGEWADKVPADSSNLAWRAADMVAAAYGARNAFAIAIEKSIPVAAGLAGGSADAAATLLACNEVMGATLSRDELDGMAALLGSDVPFLLHGGCALGTDRGTVLSPVMTRGTFHWVLATFSEGLSTSAMYGNLDVARGASFDTAPAVPESVMQGLARGDAHLLASAIGNDLQAPAIAAKPVLGRVLEFGLEHGALGGIVSGSGPTCAFLVASESEAIDLAVDLLGSGLVDGALHAHGPVHGARVVPD